MRPFSEWRDPTRFFTPSRISRDLWHTTRNREIHMQLLSTVATWGSVSRKTGREFTGRKKGMRFMSLFTSCLFPCGDSGDIRKKVKVQRMNANQRITQDLNKAQSREEGVRRVNYRTMRSMDRAQIALTSAATEFTTRGSTHTQPFDLWPFHKLFCFLRTYTLLILFLVGLGSGSRKLNG